MGLVKSRNPVLLKMLVVAACVLSAVGIVLKTIPLLSSYDDKTGLLNISQLGQSLNLGAMLCVGLAFVLLVVVAVLIVPLTKYYELGTPTLAGYALFVVTLFFLLQGLFGAAEHYQGLQDFLFEIREAGYSSSELWKLKFPYYLALVVDGFCILSAVSFYVLATEYVKESEKKHLELYLVPVVWGALVMVNVLIDLGGVVSIQSNAEKIIVTGLATLFLYYTSYWAYGYEKTPKTWFAILMRLAFPVVSLAMVVPYLVGQLFGTKDFFVDVPYLAYLGLAIYGFVVIAQVLSGATFVVNKKRK